MSYKLDYKEPVAKVIERLVKEHEELHAKLERILEESETGDLRVAISLLNLIRPEILRHAVEEEARLMRVIMQKSRNEANRSIEIMQQHRRIEEFLQAKLPYLQESPAVSARKEIREFVHELERHHEEEEITTFPLALRSKDEL